MTDARLLPCNDRVAHVSLKGRVRAEKFVDGELRQVAVQTAAILKSSNGPREREMITGERFCVLEVQGRFSFGFAEKDGYAGVVFNDILERREEVTHRVNVARSFRKDTPDIKAWEPVNYLSYGARLQVVGEEGEWARIVLPRDDEFVECFVPMQHLTPLNEPADDPIAEATKLLGTPYLWGGNSAFGIDCSGLVQAAYAACGIPIPPDSDLQAKAGTPVTGALAGGDLIFWKGHVAMVTGPDQIIHANAHHMAVAFEGLAAATDRIKSAGGGDVIAQRRFT